MSGAGTRPSGLEFLLSMLLSAILAAEVPLRPASALADDPAAAQGESDEHRQAEPGSAPGPESMCQALANAAAANDLPVAFFTRLIWQESRFRPEAVSRAGAQGVAQFTPVTARMRGLEDPFEPLQAIAKSAALLRDLNREFGNLGLAAAAYNAGPGRVREWLAGRRPLPGETRAYVRIVTGRSAEEWTAGQKDGTQKDVVEMPVARDVPCDPTVMFAQPTSPGLPLPPKRIKPWGVELVGAPTPVKALARYRELQVKYSAILAGELETHVVIRGVLGDMGAARVRVDAETRTEATKICADLRAAGWYCDVLRN
jgi:hypothetical protein